MNSSTSSSDGARSPMNRLLPLYALTLALIAGGLGMAEFVLRHQRAQDAALFRDDVPALMRTLPTRPISGREIGDQMLVNNIAFFGQYPAPLTVTSGYVGTSRSKVLRPEQFGIPSSVVGAGNSYNEITYGLLLQAEILRLRFPNLKRMYFESSMLLRRPARLIVEDDHRKYLPLLNTLAPLCDELGANAPCHRVFSAVPAAIAGKDRKWHSELFANRDEFHLATLLGAHEKSMPVLSDPLFATLRPDGERKRFSAIRTGKEKQSPEVTNDNVKVQRLRDVAGNAPWDGLFDLIALWGKQHGIQVILFQPPVRSDLYHFKVQYGLAQHVADLERVSRQYGVPFINLSMPGLGYMDDWSLFSDEDHMETCRGSGLLTLALEQGTREAEEKKILEPLLPRADVEAAGSRMLDRVCSEPMRTAER